MHGQHGPRPPSHHGNAHVTKVTGGLRVKRFLVACTNISERCQLVVRQIFVEHAPDKLVPGKMFVIPSQIVQVHLHYTHWTGEVLPARSSHKICMDLLVIILRGIKRLSSS